MNTLKQKVIDSWEVYFPKLLKYKSAYGNCNVPLNWKVDPGLSKWLLLIRSIQSKLPQTYKKQLQDIGFQLNYNEYQWELYFKELKTFVKKHKHAIVPTTNPSYITLYRWLDSQKKKCKTLSLDKNKTTLLNKLGVVWENQTILDEKWEKKWKELVAYKRRYSDCNVPRKWPKNPSLGSWVERQRSLHKTKKLPLSRKEKLTQLGFAWSQKNKNLSDQYYDSKWVKKYKSLEAYNRKYGNTLVPFEWKENPSLARWVGDQRIKYFAGKLKKEQISKLEALEFKWKPMEDSWQDRLNALINYKEKFGHLKLTNATNEYKSLGKWVSNIRTQKKKLTKEKIKSLDNLGFNWKVSKRAKSDWMKMYKSLVNYKKKHGHINVKQSDDSKLKKWLYDQKTERSPLSLERKKLLAELD